jgi:pimeloyl-ACP methyl ester carboxylesterase
MSDERSGSRLSHRGLRWLSVVFLIGAVFWVAGRLSVPDRRVPRSTPADLGVAFEALQLTTSDGLKLAAWVVDPPVEPRAAVLVFHAKDGCRSPARLALLAELGLAGLSLDHRAHGESDGLRTGFGWYERHDVAAAVAEARRRWGDLPLIGWGTSQGAAALVFAIDPEDGVLAPDTFAALVLESLYVDLETAFAQRVELSVGSWALPFAGSMATLASWRAGLGGLELSPRAALVRLAAGGLSPHRLLLASGADDQHATPAELAQLAAAVPGCESQLVPGVGHQDLLGHGPPSWRHQLVRFLTDTLGNAGH